MRQPRYLLLALALAGPLLPALARADAPPPPPNQEQMMLRDVLTKSGISCDGYPETRMLLGAEAEPYRKVDMMVFTARCGDRNYLIEYPAGYLDPPQSDAHGDPIPRPSPVVKLLPK